MKNVLNPLPLFLKHMAKSINSHKPPCLTLTPTSSTNCILLHRLLSVLSALIDFSFKLPHPEIRLYLLLMNYVVEMTTIGIFKGKKSG